MQLERLKLINFRNYPEIEISPAEKMSILIGDNAQGKTNLLEAIYLLAITKSFRGRREADLIGPPKEFSRLEAHCRHHQGDILKIEIIIQKSKDSQYLHKEIKLNSESIPARAFLGSFLAVLFSPEDINLIKSVPGSRRRFLDIIACLVSAEYCSKLVEYNKIVKNRNQILARLKRRIGNKEELIFWNNELVNRGSFIIQFRHNLLERLNKLAQNYYQQINNNQKGRKKLRLHYLPSFTLPSNLEEEVLKLRFRSELLKKENTEIERQQSVIGPHRDDFHFLLQGRSIVAQGSRGEFRSAILALKLAELDFLEEELEERPLLLLDDVFSELDQKRRERVSKIIQNQQTLITTTDLRYIPPDLKKKALIWKIKEGKINRIRPQKIKP